MTEETEPSENTAAARWKGFPKGNQFWQARSSAGPKPKFADGEALMAACQEYFDWARDNPLWEAKLVSHMGHSTLESVPRVRVLTLGSLLLFLDVSSQVWSEWKALREDLAGVIAAVESAIREQKFSGAASGFFNANIIARDLGLVDRIERKDAPTRGVVVTTSDPAEAAKAYQQMIAEDPEGADGS